MLPLAELAALARCVRPYWSSIERSIPTVSTAAVCRTGLARSAFDTTIVATWPPTPPLMPEESESSASSHSMMIWPPALYQLVACTDGMKLDRNASLSANSSAAVSVGTPVWPSLVRFGVYQTKSGGLAALRSLVSVDEIGDTDLGVREVLPGVVPHGVEA